MVIASCIIATKSEISSSADVDADNIIVEQETEESDVMQILVKKMHTFLVRKWKKTCTSTAVHIN
jgi:hypothetical protein